MKILRYLMMAVLVLGMSGIAHAFQFSVLDPQDPNPYPVLPGVPFTVQFFPDCPTILGGPDSGCFFAINNSTTTLTSLEITFPDNGQGGTNGQSVFCPTSNAASLFGTASCSLSNGLYTLDFSGGSGIASGQTFVLIEDCDANDDCVPADNFPEGTAVANPTPEPSSIWMALTGMGSLGYALRRRRRA